MKILLSQTAMIQLTIVNWELKVCNIHLMERGIFHDKLRLGVEMDCSTKVRKFRVTLYKVHKPHFSSLPLRYDTFDPE